MAVASLYNESLLNLATGTYDPVNLRVALLTSATFDPLDLFFADISASEIAAVNGYTAGGTPIPGANYAIDGVDGAKLDGGDVSWTAVGGPISATHAVIYDLTSDSLLLFIDFEGTESAPPDTEFLIVWDSSGIINFAKAV